MVDLEFGREGDHGPWPWHSNAIRRFGFVFLLLVFGFLVVGFLIWLGFSYYGEVGSAKIGIGRGRGLLFWGIF